MSNRRVPLANIHNAANSPFRAVAAAASKRSRSQNTTHEDLGCDEPRPAKKQIIEVAHSAVRTPPRRQIPQHAEGRVFNKRPANSQITAFEKKLLAAKERQTQQKPARQEKALNENLESIRQWQRHYRRVFPQFVFYFESVPDDVRLRCSKQVLALGAREEKFFSKEVTHVVTTRAIPPGSDATASSIDTNPSPSVSTSSLHTNQSRTINPSLLERSLESIQTRHQTFAAKSKFAFDASTGRRLHVNGINNYNNNQDVESRRQPAGNADILHRAKEMGMKIWQLEKLQRMMTTMFDTDMDLQPPHGHNTRSNTVNDVGAGRLSRDVDLSHMLRNEQLHGSLDRDTAVASRELILFKGPYIYIRDVDEKTKPVMVKEYAKVSHRGDGTWPQFRAASTGKCPFIQDLAQNRREFEKEKARERGMLARARLENGAAPRTRAITALSGLESTKMQPPLPSKRKRPLEEAENGANQMTRGVDRTPGLGSDPCTAIAAKPRNPENLVRQFPPAVGPRLHGGEPAASGMQPSNITSAIRSQMVSSTASAPGARAGTSREVQELKRKVLEKNTGPTFTGIPTSRRMTDLAGAARAESNVPAARQAKRKAQEKLGFIHEDFTPSEEEENARKATLVKKANASQKKRVGEKDPKPGYCENCRDKFGDFDDHILSRKHRSFALAQDNWKELDALLSHLGRPDRDDDSLEF
ncbi:Zinc finger, DBF-type [Lasallia pustulata]|uniref:Zinc finger, DBF-type n=1 Tax=Lasallia pustulata TaxID=136370 RepID=A0A1W5CT76_9LECA|nr:Zinc finger, DBF-type [Lasallia pustulata]